MPFDREKPPARWRVRSPALHGPLQNAIPCCSGNREHEVRGFLVSWASGLTLGRDDTGATTHAATERPGETRSA